MSSASTNKKGVNEILQELSFWFESEGKRYKKFREDEWYRAIFNAIRSGGFESFIPLHIDKYIRLNHPELIGELESHIVGRKIGSKLKQLVSRSILKITSRSKAIRQNTYEVNSDIRSELEKYVEQWLEKAT